MKRIVIGFMLGLLVLAFAPQYSFAETCGCSEGSGRDSQGMPMMSPMQHDGTRMTRRGHHLWKALMRLGLDEKQKAAIREIKSRVMKDTIRKRADIAVARIDLREILHKDQVDMSAAEATLNKIASLQTSIRLSHIQAMQEIKAKLTPEQRKKFKEMHEMGPMAERMKHGHMHMTPPTEKNNETLQEKTP